MHIRKETATDYEAVYSVVKRAFESAEQRAGFGECPAERRCVHP